MAYWIDENGITGRGGSSRQIPFFADYESDIDNLPTMTAMGVQQGEDTVSCQKVSRGSTTLVLETGNLYILGTDNEWIKV